MRHDRANETPQHVRMLRCARNTSHAGHLFATTSLGNVLPMQVLSKPESLPPAHTPSSGKGGGEGGGAHDTHVGFWRNPKRFNVAVTRAKALLVVVGHTARAHGGVCPRHHALLLLA